VKGDGLRAIGVIDHVPGLSHTGFEQIGYLIQVRDTAESLPDDLDRINRLRHSRIHGWNIAGTHEGAYQDLGTCWGRRFS
jgi:hypothetical protein